MSAPELLVATRLKSFPDVERIVLFGSRARGDAGPRADIDLAIELLAEIDREGRILYEGSNGNPQA